MYLFGRAALFGVWPIFSCGPIFIEKHARMIDLKGPQYEPLTPEEEQELWPQAKQGNEKARERIICSTLRSVVKECYKYVNAYDVDELISMGLSMAVEAFDRYDPAKGVRFYSYVVLRVRWRIGEILRDAKNTVHIDNIAVLEAFGGYEETPDIDEKTPDTEEERQMTIRNYLLSHGVTPELFEVILKHIEEKSDHIPKDLQNVLNNIKATPEILQAIKELIGFDRLAKAVAAKRERHNEHAREYLKTHPEQRERNREYCKRKYIRRKMGEDCPALEQPETGYEEIRAEKKRQREAARLALAEHKAEKRRQREAERENIRAEREAEREKLRTEREAARLALAEQRKERKREYQREYKRRPEQKERTREYQREYNRRPERIEHRREYMREYNRRKTEAARLALAEHYNSDLLEDLKRQIDELKRENEELKRQMEEADKAVVLQRFLDPYKERRRKAVANYNTLYCFIIKYTDATPMQAEAAAYMTLQGFDTLKAWSVRHGLVYESVKRWRMQVKRKLAALEDVDADIIALDRSLFKS